MLGTWRYSNYLYFTNFLWIFFFKLMLEQKKYLTDSSGRTLLFPIRWTACSLHHFCLFCSHMCMFLYASTNGLIEAFCIVSEWLTAPLLAFPCNVSAYHDWEHLPVLVWHMGFDEWCSRQAELGSILILSSLQVAFKKLPGQHKTADISLLSSLLLQISESQGLGFCKLCVSRTLKKPPREVPYTRQDPQQGQQEWKKLLQTARGDWHFNYQGHFWMALWRQISFASTFS